MQPGDVVATAANAFGGWVGFKPSTPIEIGVQRLRWYALLRRLRFAFSHKTVCRLA